MVNLSGRRVAYRLRLPASAEPPWTDMYRPDSIIQVWRRAVAISDAPRRAASRFGPPATRLRGGVA